MKLWEVSHPFYCERSNYALSKELSKVLCETHYRTFDEFLLVWGEEDAELNLLFRWDWYAMPGGRDHLLLFWLQQRRGHFCWSVVEVGVEDEPRVRAFIEEKWAHLRKLWAPVSDEWQAHETLNEVLSNLGIVTGPGKFPGTKELFRGGQSIGSFTANEAWGWLRRHGLVPNTIE